MRRTAYVVLAAFGGLLVALEVGVRRWDRATARAVARLGEQPSEVVGHATFTLDQLDGLPAPVARYFRFALTPGQPLVRRAVVRSVGEFALKPGAWAPFTSVQHFRVGPPGFVWDARIRMAPGPAVRVRDGYAGGEGSMTAAYAGLLAVVDEQGTPEMAAASLLRFLAEAPWVPTALLPASGVAWEAADDSTARATLTDGATRVSMDVHFGPRGEIVRIVAERYRDVDGVSVLAPWEGHFRDYERHDGMRIPMTGEVGWLLPEGRHDYYRGRITDVEYGLAPAP
jgi:hypothetical protein